MKKHLILTLIVILISALLVSCNQSQSPVSSESNNNSEIHTDQLEAEQITLAQEGYSIEYATPQDNGTTIIELNKDGDSQKYYGLVNSDFQWVLEPTNTIVSMENFHDGFAAAAILDTREMRSVSNDDGQLWGYLDKDGNWVIEPQYAEANSFSNGLAVVTTIETDRDDLTNRRGIVIDQEGNEVFEIEKEYQVAASNASEEVGPDYQSYRFLNGYLLTDHGFYDVEGNFTELNLPEGQRALLMIDNKILTETFGDDSDIEEHGLRIIDTTGNVLNTYKDSELHESYSMNQIPVDNYDHIDKYKRFVISDEERMNVYMDIDGNQFFKGGFRVSGDYLVTYNFNPEEKSDITFYDLNGKKISQSSQIVYTFPYNNKYWIKGNEYAEFVDMNGQVLIDESKRIEPKDYQDDIEALESPIYKAAIRITEDDPEFTDCLINLDTLEIITFDELLT